jgi:hypothetical protein
MKMRIFTQLEDGVYNVIIHTEDWSQRDIQLMEKYGEPEIDVGGSFDGDGSSGSATFDLDSKLYGVKTASPFSQGFDARDYEDAGARALVWKTEIQHRITEAVLELREQDDEFTKEEVVSV